MGSDMRKALFAILLASAACTTTDAGVEDLGAFDAGKADVQAITVPLRVAAGETAELVLDVNGAFEIVTAYPEGVDVTLAATDGVTPAEISGRAPKLVVRAATGVPTAYTITVTNASTTAIKGTLRIQPPSVPVCDDGLWTGWLTTLSAKLASANGFIDANEKTAIDALVAAQPCKATSGVAYEAWFKKFDATLVGTNGFIDANEQVFVDILRSVQPVSTAIPAYLGWLPAFAKQLRDANGFIDANEQVFFDHRIAVRPRITDEASYVEWAKILEAQLVAANGFVDANETAVMSTTVLGKPCASGVAAQAAWNRLTAITATNAVPIVTAATPTAGCE